MRAIKFRAWDETRGVFHFGPSNLMLDMGGTKYWQFGFDDPRIIEKQDDYILEQFTGLHDKNGKEIYEGDIVLFGDNKIHGGTHGKVEWIVPKAGFFYSFIDGQYKGKLTDMADDWRSYEVIGNIHETPELLK